MTNITVYIVNTNLYSEEQLLQKFPISEEQLNKASKQFLRRGKEEQIVSEYFKNRFVGTYSKNEYGKPISVKGYFNISHSRGIVCFVMCEDRQIGIDIEVKREIKERVYEAYLSYEEKDYIKLNERKYYKCWTRKEAIVKMIGCGIMNDFADVPSFQQDTGTYKGIEYYIRSFAFEDLHISVCLEGKEDFKVKFEEVK